MFRTWFSKLAFGQKIQLVMNLVSISVLVVALCMIAVSFYTKFKQDLEDRVLQKASLLADAAAVGVVFEQDESVTVLLGSLGVDRSVDQAVVYKKAGEEFVYFAHYARDKNFTPQAYRPGPRSQWVEQQFILRLPIQVDGEDVGLLYVREDNLYLRDMVQASVAYLLPVLLLASLFIWLVSRTVQERLARPLRQLTSTVHEVAQSHDYDRRVEIDSKDELGDLGNAFNSMMKELSDFEVLREEKEREILDLNLALEEKVKERTKELSASLDNLRLTQQQLVEQEKMASLGELVAGVAHEINTPIGVGITAVSYLNESLTQLKSQFMSGALTKAEFTGHLDSLTESAGIVAGNLSRAAELVKAFKSVAVDQSSSEPRTIELANYVQDILMSLRPKLKRFNHQISVDIDNDIQIYCDPGIISQIVTNFVMNSLHHAFTDVDQGHIEITARVQDEMFYLDYRDDGQGIDPSIAKRLFEPFVTTKRGQGGSGLGTHVIYNLVTQVLGGHIHCDSEPGKGVHFQITAPMSRLTARPLV